MSTAQSTSAPTVANMPLATLNTVVLKTTVPFATASAIPPAIAQTVSAHFAMTRDMSSQTAPSQRTPVAELSSMTETQRDSSLVPVVQVFEGGIVTVQGQDIIFSIFHWSPLTSSSPLTFTVSTMFFTDVYQYVIW